MVISRVQVVGMAVGACLLGALVGSLIGLKLGDDTQSANASQSLPARAATPQLVGQSKENAAAALRKAGLTAHAKYACSSHPPGIVTLQHPAAGNTTTRGEALIIEISAGTLRFHPGQDLAFPTPIDVRGFPWDLRSCGLHQVGNRIVPRQTAD